MRLFNLLSCFVLLQASVFAESEFESSGVYSDNYSMESAPMLSDGNCCLPEYQPCIRVEAAPAYLHVDVLENNNTVKTDELYGGRLDVAFPVPFYPCIFLKPVVMAGWGKGHSDIWAVTLNMGYLYEYNDCFSFAPVIGVSYTEFHTTVHYRQFNDIKIKEKFHSTCVLLGGDLIYKFWDCWRFVGSYYYGFSNCKTHYENLFTVKSNTGGSSFYGMIEKDINACYSVNLGAGYNGSFSEDKDGIRAWGLKIGLVRWF